MSAIDAFLNAAMILSGMVPWRPCRTMAPRSSRHSMQSLRPAALRHRRADPRPQSITASCTASICRKWTPLRTSRKVMHERRTRHEPNPVDCRAQYPLTEFAGIADYEAKITPLGGRGRGAGAELLVFPEYGSMELCSIGAAGHDLFGSIRCGVGPHPRDRPRSWRAGEKGMASPSWREAPRNAGTMAAR